ncbi:hypothetical protein FN846DRAFT_887391 [Sphaerosporella brunnea]|uniref:Uncharacterized protein n=1 Tax=Sphaerosporella brunnea TaxID=1250544 RepID=A0A5J5F6C8_9PEZI|nr:hypothetical protein FN846DRAFT_887391 [Sphaerosporella brunnea]
MIYTFNRANARWKRQRTALAISRRMLSPQRAPGTAEKAGFYFDSRSGCDAVRVGRRTVRLETLRGGVPSQTAPYCSRRLEGFTEADTKAIVPFDREIARAVDPAALRPAPHDRLRHRINISAIKRRTEDVIKAATRLQNSAHGPQFLRRKGSDLRSAQGRHRRWAKRCRLKRAMMVRAQAPDASEPLDAQIAPDIGAVPTLERTHFSYAEVQLLIRIAASSPTQLVPAPGVFGSCSVTRLTPEDIGEVLETVIRWVEGGCNGNSRAGGGKQEEEEEDEEA